jgi:hypothetical protein
MGKKSGSGSGMNNPDLISESLETIKFGSRIRDKHSGSATLDADPNLGLPKWCRLAFPVFFCGIRYEFFFLILKIKQIILSVNILQLSYKEALRRAHEKWKDMSKMERRPFLHLASLESIRYKSEVDYLSSECQIYILKERVVRLLYLLYIQMDLLYYLLCSKDQGFGSAFI